MLQKLRGLFRDISRRRTDVRAVGGFDHQKAIRQSILGLLVKHHLVHGPLGNDEVILLVEFQRAEGGVHRSRAVMDEDALIAHRVLEVIIHRLRGQADRHLAIAVAEEHDAAGDRIALGCSIAGFQVTHAHHVGFDVFGLGRIQRLPAGDLRGRMDVVHRRGWSDESLGAKDLLGIQRAIGPAELDVAFGRKLAEFAVERHGGPRGRETERR